MIIRPKRTDADKHVPSTLGASHAFRQFAEKSGQNAEQIPRATLRPPGIPQPWYNSQLSTRTLRGFTWHRVLVAKPPPPPMGQPDSVCVVDEKVLWF